MLFTTTKIIKSPGIIYTDMKYFDSYKQFESNDPSMVDLTKFYKEFVAGTTQMQQHWKNYKIDTNKIKELVKVNILTPELIAELTRRKITVPDISRLRMTVEKTQYHRIFKYVLSDASSFEPEKERFSVGIDVQVPFEEEFEADNTLITGTIWIKRHGRYKELFGYANMRLQKDPEFNYYSAGTVLQKAYSELFPKQ